MVVSERLCSMEEWPTVRKLVGMAQHCAWRALGPDKW
jgi:hypothetical protein